MRGQINNIKRRQQIIDTSGLRYGNKTSTDLDGYIDFGNKLSVFFEIKLEGTPLEYGQRLALERLNNDVAKSKPSLLIIADHAIYDTDKPIPVDTCLVREYHSSGKWHKGNANCPMVKDLIDLFLKHNKMMNEIKCNLDEDGKPRDDSWMKGL